VYAAAASGETGILIDALNAVDYSRDDIVSCFVIVLKVFLESLKHRTRCWSSPQDLDVTP